MMILRSTLTPKLLTEIWTALLWERRVILKSKSLATLTDVTAALEELLYPFKVRKIFWLLESTDLILIFFEGFLVTISHSGRVFISYQCLYLC